MPRCIRRVLPLPTKLNRTFHIHRTLRQQRDWYRVLGVDKTANKQQIREAYLKHVKEKHPDVRDTRQKSDQQFIDVQEAYAVLSNETARREYDAGRQQKTDDIQNDESRSQHFKTKPPSSENKFGMRRERFAEQFAIKDYKVGHPSMKQDFDKKTENKLRVLDLMTYATILVVILGFVASKTMRKNSKSET